MTTTRASHLGEVVSALIDRERLSVAQIMRSGQLSRITIDNLKNGKTNEPSRRTLTRLARALATAPKRRVLDHQKMNTIERQLHIAAGYADPTKLEADGMLELLLYYRLGSLERAQAWISTIERYETLDALAVRALGPAAPSRAPTPR